MKKNVSKIINDYYFAIIGVRKVQFYQTLGMKMERHKIQMRNATNAREQDVPAR